MTPRGGVRGLLARVGGEHARSLFFNRLWVGAAVGVLLVGLLSERSALTLLALLTLLSAGLMAGWNRATLAMLSCERLLPTTRAMPGDVIPMTVTVTNRKPLPVPWLTIEEDLPEHLEPVDRPTTVSGNSGRRVLSLGTGLGAWEQVSWRIDLRCRARGVATVGAATLRSSDPLGFFTNRAVVPGEHTVLVLPRIVRIPAPSLPSLQPLGDVKALRQVVTDPLRIVGVRDYQPEDPFRSIHWKATARQGRLQVRVAEPTTALQLAIFVNLDTFDHYWEGLDIATAERVIEVAAAVAAWADRARVAFGMYGNGVVAGMDQALRVPPARDPAQLGRVLEGLAKISPYSTLPFTKVLDAESGRFPWGSTVIVITRMMPPQLASRLAAMTERGLRVVLLPVGDCPIPAVRRLSVRSVEAAWGSADPIADAS